MLIPLYGFLQGDTLGLVILAHDTMTLGEVAAKLRRSASVRIEVDGDVEISANGALLSLDMTVAEAGLRSLDRVDVFQIGSR